MQVSGLVPKKEKWERGETAHKIKTWGSGKNNLTKLKNVNIEKWI